GACRAAHGSSPAPARPDRETPGASAAGRPIRPLRPRNSVRSAVYDLGATSSARNAMRFGKSGLHALRAWSDPVSASNVETTCLAASERVTPRIHSAYAVTEMER